ncbi:MAG: DUF4145 domain-containing protein, partial [Rhizonema sp. NSF051]|nr:DUF4145 domain-containing protein [Rhizonema sp. NSF051]
KNMDFIDVSEVCNWMNFEGLKEGTTPNKVSTVCPHCDSWVTLDTEAHMYVSAIQTCNMMAICPKCRQISKLWAIYKQNENNPGLMACTQLWILPKRKSKEVIFQKDLINADIYDAYEEAVKVFNNSHWRACVNECGRALEAITKDKFKTKDLRKSLKTISDKKIDAKDNIEVVKSILFDPVLQMSSAIRLGRLTGVHFDIKGKADKEVAEKVLNMTEYLIQYFYILPNNAMQLEKTIEALGDKGLIEEEE